MFYNYFKIAWRNILKNNVYSIINILGLSLGIAACTVIFLIVQFEYSFDRFHPDVERIYRITGEIKRPDGGKEFINSPIREVAGIEHAIPGFEAKAALYFYNGKVSIETAGEKIKSFESRDQIVITEPDYFKIFQYQWLSGNPSSALNQPFSVVLSEKRGRQYFGNIPTEQMIGRTVVYDDSLKMSVTGIVSDWTQHSDFVYTDFMSLSTAPVSFLKSQLPKADWSSLSPHQSMAFVKLLDKVDATQINSRLTSFVSSSHIKFPPGAALKLELQPLSTIHFTNDFHRGDDGDNFRKPYLPTLYALVGLALFILIIAAINFINLSTALSLQRVKEIGVRKVMGSSKKNIMLQFLIETAVLTSVAMLLSLLIVNPILHLFHDYIPAGIIFHPFSGFMIAFLMTLAWITTLLAGFYPAVVLSSFMPVLSLKGSFSSKGTDRIDLRKALLVFQFCIAIIFIIGAIIIGSQIRYMNRADKGFNTDAIITINNWNDHEGKLKLLANQFRQIPGVDKVLLQGSAPMGFAQNIDQFVFKGKDDIQLQVSAQIGDESFIPFYQMKLLAGRNMLHSDSMKELVINETYARTIGFNKPDDAIGKLLYQGSISGQRAYPIVGVVADFHTGSFHEAIQPTVIENQPNRIFSVAVKLNNTKRSAREVNIILSQMGIEWIKIFPDRNFEYSILNESIATLFEQEQKTAWLINIAMGITIFISSMGLFGLAIFTVKHRTKEIGIRKVLGASVTAISAMLFSDFFKLILIALLIAAPISWYLMEQWLNDFAYRISINWWVYPVAGMIILMIALITISFQAVKAALANPVESLRTE